MEDKHNSSFRRAEKTGEGNMDQKPRGFKGLLAWQKAYSLTLDIYKVTKKFPRTVVYGLVSQLQRAAISIPANIAEGYERGHRKEYMQFLYISKGSLGEVETHLMIAKDPGYISATDYLIIEEKRSEATRLLSGLSSLYLDLYNHPDTWTLYP